MADVQWMRSRLCAVMTLERPAPLALTQQTWSVILHVPAIYTVSDVIIMGSNTAANK